ncbi:MAG: tRNA 2-thiocytidine biosynthesis protein TtcA [Firmicutes bacterium]|nr:tRNA 2-thiocytidine biosynthesis protein TtcA [Bacillota bacterium]
MRMSLPRHYARRIWRAIIEFELLAPKDQILVGYSGGKDSLFLLYALKALQAKSPFPFTFAAAHVELGFSEQPGVEELAAVCQDLNIPFYCQETKIADLAAKDDNPCSTCAYFRRAVVNRIANTEGYNKVALAHHHDDAVETFFMSQLYSGQLQTFLPKSMLDETGLTVIRPLVYLRESKIKEFVENLPWKPTPNPCPFQGRTHRFRVKELIRGLTSENPSVYHNVAACMRKSAAPILWPAALDREAMREKHIKIMNLDPDGIN